MSDNRSTLTSLGQSLIGALPAQFIMLVLLNTIFIIGLLWFLDRQREARVQAFDRVLDACMQQIPRPRP